MTMKASRGSPAVPASTASLDGSYSSTLTNLADSLRLRSLRTVSTAAAISSAVKGASGLPTPTSSLCFKTIASTLLDVLPELPHLGFFHAARGEQRATAHVRLVAHTAGGRHGPNYW